MLHQGVLYPMHPQPGCRRVSTLADYDRGISVTGSAFVNGVIGIVDTHHGGGR